MEVPSLPGLYGEAEFVIRDRKSSLLVVSTEPAEGAVGVAEGENAISITFSNKIQLAGNFVNVNAFLRPGEGSGRLKDLTLSSDGKTVSGKAELVAGQTYSLTIVNAVSVNQSALTEPVTITFSTGSQVAVLATIRGKINLADLVPAASKQATADPSAIEILFGEVIAVQANGEQAGQGGVDSTGAYELKIAEGDYTLYAKVETNKGTTTGNLGSVSAISGQITEAADAVLAPPQPKSASPVSLVVDTGAESPIKIDLDATAQNQAVTSSLAAPGDLITMGVYIEGVSDLAGYELQVQYDSTAVSLEGATADGSGESNLLKVNGGFVVGFATVRGNTVSLAEAILGPTAENLGQGTGLLGVFSFRVSPRFLGTTELVATQLLLSAQSGGTDTIRAFSRAQIEVAGPTRQMSVTASRDTLNSSGSDESTLTVKLYDLDGIAFSKDDTSVVSFEVTSSNGALSGAKSENKTVIGGQTTTKVKATGDGNITVLISLPDARPVQAVLVVPSAPAIGEGPVGPVALDLNATDAGDQALRITKDTPKAGDTVVIEIVATEGASGLAGFQSTIQFDS